jgi:glycosyltransferase involved in cell wall biosynthesis
MKIKYLLIGPEPLKSDPAAAGGVIILYANLLEWMTRQGIEHISINSNKTNYGSKALACITIIKKLFQNISKCETVMLNGTALDYTFLIPIVVFLSHIYRKQVILRKFAGHFYIYFQERTWIFKKIISWSLKNAGLLCWETKQLVQFGEQFNKNNIWLPNVRFSPGIKIAPQEIKYHKRFCFISHVSKQKGILDLYDAGGLLPKGYTIDIYGPITDDHIDINSLSSSCVFYRGILDNTQVISTLRQYDCLLLPTHWITEGYPGIIIEAFSAGIPVIANRIGGISEIVEDGIDGILCETGNIKELCMAILSIDSEKLLSLKMAALKKFEQFDADKVYRKVFDAIGTS